LAVAMSLLMPPLLSASRSETSEIRERSVIPSVVPHSPGTTEAI
jgi:hypothetical protein